MIKLFHRFAITRNSELAGTRELLLNFFLPQPIIHIATTSWSQILKIIITESTMGLSFVSLTLMQKNQANSKNVFLQ
jgi:hypothetical protein